MSSEGRLWYLVEPYAEKATLHFFGQREHDAEDAMQEAALICMRVWRDNPAKPIEELSLIARRSVWHYCIDVLRHKQVEHRAHFDASLLRKCRVNGCRPEQVRVDAAEILARVKSAIPSTDHEVFELASLGHSWAEMARKTGKSITAVNHSLNRIHTAARRYKDGA